MRQLSRFAILPMLFSMLLFSVSASAATESLTGTSTFAEAKKVWQELSDVSSPDINGNWQRITVFEHENCKNIMHGNAHDDLGIKNSDGSVFTLSFEGHQVKFLNVGRAANTQGPYEIQSKTTNFSSWAYDENTENKEMTDQAFGNYVCREGKNTTKQIVCAIGTRLKKEAISDPIFKACSSLKTGIIVVFQKTE